MAKDTDSPLGVLLKAIIAKHRSITALKDAMKGPWLHTKPSRFNDEPDYAIIIPGISIDAGWTCKRRYWLHEPEFRFYGKTPEAANAHANLWSETFGSESLTLSLDVGGLIMHRVTRVGMVELEPHQVEYASITMRFRTWGNRSPLPA